MTLHQFLSLVSLGAHLRTSHECEWQLTLRHSSSLLAPKRSHGHLNDGRSCYGVCVCVCVCVCEVCTRQLCLLATSNQPLLYCAWDESRLCPDAFSCRPGPSALSRFHSGSFRMSDRSVSAASSRTSPPSLTSVPHLRLILPSPIASLSPSLLAICQWKASLRLSPPSSSFSRSVKGEDTLFPTRSHRKPTVS